MLLFLLYLAFVCLGVPDAFLGAAWPALSKDLAAPLSAMGIVTVIFSAGKVLASTFSQRLQFRLGAGKLVLLSVAVTAASLFGMGASGSFPVFCLWAVPYGLASGSASTAINKVVALRYENRHMNWLHCMWGVGSALGPYLIAAALRFRTWHSGYLWGGLLLSALTAVLVFTLPLWKANAPAGSTPAAAPMKLAEILRLAGAKPMMVTFFAYCALEQATALWAATYLVYQHGVDQADAAGYASLFFIGMTVGRALSGFLSRKWTDLQLIRVGQGFVLLGVLLLVQPFWPQLAILAMLALGLGCAPMYPSLLHSVPAVFGPERSPAVLGVLMACANAGTLFMPTLFGWLSGFTGVAIYPWFLGVILVILTAAHGRAVRGGQTGAR